MIIAIIQARMGSSRLPGKSLVDICGKANLLWVYQRLNKSQYIDRIVIATTDQEADDEIEHFCRNQNLECFRGSENDVLDRYYHCAKQYGGDIVVRVTGDCPVIDYEVVDMAIAKYIEVDDEAVYVSNCEPRTYPDGLDVEVFSMDLLEEAYYKANLKSEREHVTVYIREQNENRPIVNERDYSGYRLTLDHKEDLVVITAIFEALLPLKIDFDMADMVGFLDDHAEIRAINNDFDPNEGLKKSISEDKIVK